MTIVRDALRVLGALTDLAITSPAIRYANRQADLLAEAEAEREVFESLENLAGFLSSTELGDFLASLPRVNGVQSPLPPDASAVHGHPVQDMGANCAAAAEMFPQHTKSSAVPPAADTPDPVPPPDAGSGNQPSAPGACTRQVAADGPAPAPRAEVRGAGPPNSVGAGCDQSPGDAAAPGADRPLSELLKRAAFYADDVGDICRRFGGHDDAEQAERDADEFRIAAAQMAAVEAEELPDS